MALLVVGTVLIRLLDVDLKVATVFFVDGAWPWREKPFIQLLYRHGSWPVVLVSSIAILVWIASAFHTAFRPHRRLAMFLVLVLAIGSGLLVNAIFKDHFGRPRPAEVTLFGGTREFAPVWEPHIGQGGGSFPSGHAAMGFYWLCLGVYFSERNRRAAAAFTALGLIHGACMGFGRMAQGQHWLSDVLWSAGFIYFTAWALYGALRLRPELPPSRSVSDEESVRRG